MKTNTVHVCADKLWRSLDTITVGRMSSAVVTIGGDIPDDMRSVSLVVEYAADGETRRYSATAAPQGDGTYRAYIAPVYFPEASSRLRYHVAGKDAMGNARWLGSGSLRVVATPLDDAAALPDTARENDIRIALYGLADDTLADTATQRETREMVQKILAVLKAAAAGATGGADPVNRRTIVYDADGTPHEMSVVRDESGELTTVVK